MKRLRVTVLAQYFDKIFCQESFSVACVKSNSAESNSETRIG